VVVEAVEMVDVVEEDVVEVGIIYFQLLFI